MTASRAFKDPSDPQTLDEILACQKHLRAEMVERVKAFEADKRVRSEFRARLLSLWQNLLQQIDDEIANTEAMLTTGVGVSKH